MILFLELREIKDTMQELLSLQIAIIIILQIWVDTLWSWINKNFSNLCSKMSRGEKYYREQDVSYANKLCSHHKTKESAGFVDFKSQKLGRNRPSANKPTSTEFQPIYPLKEILWLKIDNKSSIKSLFFMSYLLALELTINIIKERWLNFKKL